MMDARPVVFLSGATQKYGFSEVLKGVSLQLHAGKFYALLGRNGVGKSTLMKVLMGTEPMCRGQGEIFGHSLEQERGNLNQDIGYVSEAIEYHYPGAIENLFTSLSKFYPRWDQTFFHEIIRHLGIDTRKNFLQFSRGQKMQAVLAFVLATRPKLILLDEVTSVLDADARSFLMNHLRNFTQAGGTVLMTTNLVFEVQAYADHLFIIEEGLIKFDVETAKLASMFIKLKRDPKVPVPQLDRPDLVQVGMNSDGSVSYLFSIDEIKKREFTEDFLITHADKRRVTAEEAFLYFTKRQGA